MGVTNYGNQTISFKYNEPGRSEAFNKLNYRIAGKGIYEGGLLSYVDATTVQIAPFISVIEDSITKVGIRLETAEAVNLTVSTAVPYIVIRFNWANLTNNYADILAVAEVDLDDDDLIAGMCIYDANILQTSFDYTLKSYTQVDKNTTQVDKNTTQIDINTPIVTQNAEDISNIADITIPELDSKSRADTIVNTGGIFIPLYNYPADIFNNEDWNRVMDTLREYPSVGSIIAINPASGPGTVTDGNYRVGIDRLHGAGATVIGYVSTDYTNNSLATVKLDIDTWIALYPEIDGIFLDEMTVASVQANYDYYSELTTYVRQSGLILSVANPGAPFPKAYIDNECADMIIGWESNIDPTLEQASEDYDEGASAYPYYKRGILLYEKDEWSAYNILKEFKKYYGWIYSTSGLSPNPWGTIPSYLSSVFSTANTVKQTIEDGNDKLSSARTPAITALINGKRHYPLKMNIFGESDNGKGTDLHVRRVRVPGHEHLYFIEGAGAFTGAFWKMVPNEPPIFAGIPSYDKALSYSRTTFVEDKYMVTVGAVAPVDNDTPIAMKLEISNDDTLVTGTYIGDLPGDSSTTSYVHVAGLNDTQVAVVTSEVTGAYLKVYSIIDDVITLVDSSRAAYTQRIGEIISYLENGVYVNKVMVYYYSVYVMIMYEWDPVGNTWSVVVESATGPTCGSIALTSAGNGYVFLQANSSSSGVYAWQTDGVSTLIPPASYMVDAEDTSEANDLAVMAVDVDSDGVLYGVLYGVNFWQEFEYNSATELYTIPGIGRTALTSSNSGGGLMKLSENIAVVVDTTDYTVFSVDSSKGIITKIHSQTHDGLMGSNNYCCNFGEGKALIVLTAGGVRQLSWSGTAVIQEDFSYSDTFTHLNWFTGGIVTASSSTTGYSYPFILYNSEMHRIDSKVSFIRGDAYSQMFNYGNALNNFILERPSNSAVTEFKYTEGSYAKYSSDDFSFSSNNNYFRMCCIAPRIVGAAEQYGNSFSLLMANNNSLDIVKIGSEVSGIHTAHVAGIKDRFFLGVYSKYVVLYELVYLDERGTAFVNS